MSRRSELAAVLLATSIIAIVFITLDLLLNPNVSWSIYVSLFLLLWPFSLLPHPVYSTIGAIWIAGLLTAINVIETPVYLWVLYTVPLIWWPLSAWYPHQFKTKPFAWISFLILGGYYVMLNFIYDDRFPWSIFLLFALLWWPFTRQWSNRPIRYSYLMATTTSIFFVVVNLITTPHEIWAVYPIFAVLWWPLAMTYFYRRNKETHP
ncbi:hypothetical protein [Geomicrobium sediminis]|uniref:Uncharacterized protein n=1 Tax=Geomicrobium sediminis TaxID=1347788 RepID=A0ABS2P8R2_9BACL|nr:hypothetical protein [Geomicrobium sediminis]MBM7631213.1 hypothetical protein [Geomicrobium sediminis]